MLPKINSSLPHPTFSALTIADRSMLGHELEIREPADEYKRIRVLRQKMEAALWGAINDVLGRGGLHDPNLLSALRNSEDVYLPVREQLMRDPKNRDLVASYSREQYDVAPPQHSKKLNIGNNIPVWTSGMHDIFPGTDPQHRSFLKKHRALMHFPERVASLGGVFVSPPDLTVEQQMEILTHLRNADPYWRTVPCVFEDTTIGELKKLLSHFEDGWPATVEDKAGEVLGVIDLKMIPPHTKDSTFITDFIDRDKFSESLAPDGIYSPDAAFDHMDENNKEYLFRWSEKGEKRVPLVMTKSMPYFSHILKPFEFEGGLGSVVYLGVSNAEKSKEDLRKLMNFKIAGAIVDTAHTFRGSVEILLRDMANAHPDLPLGTGSFNNPLAVRVFSKFLHFLKGPIGSGGVCNTYHTGVDEADAFASVQIAAAAGGDIPILLDGLGGGRKNLEDYRVPQYDDTGEFTKSMALPGVIGKQGGGSHIGRIESCNPFESVKGIVVKSASGEGSANANKRKMKTNGNHGKEDPRSRQKRASNAQYSEGVNEKIYPIRYPANLPDFYYLLAMRLRAAMSYSLSVIPPSPNGEEKPKGYDVEYYQNHAEIIHKG